MGFFMDGLDAEAYDRTYSDRDLVRRIIGYFRPSLRLMAFASVAVVLAATMDAVLPILLSRGIDTVAVTRDLSTIGALGAGIVAAGLLSFGFNFIRQVCTARAVGDTVLRLRSDAVDAVLARDLSFYDEFPSAKIVSRVTSDTEGFTNVVTLALGLVSQVLLVMIIIGAMFYLNVRLALLALIIAPGVMAVALGFRHLARRYGRRAQRALARVNSSVQEAVTGITVAKNFRQEAMLYREFEAINEQAYQVNLRVGLLYSGVFPLLLAVTNIGTVIIIYFGGMAAHDHTVSAGTWFLFVQSIGIFWFPLTSIASFWSQFQTGLAASERVFALIDAKPRVQQTGDERVEQVAGQIEFRDLDFRYTAQESVLRGFNLTIRAGETVAFVGHTGAGKSTIGKLVARFYEFQGGELLIDGRDIRSFDLPSYRRHLGVVPQSPFLFSGTVAENIGYARPDATRAEIEAVARHVGRGDWIEALPDGLETAVGEGGRGLSMGQRQLVALARVVLQDPSILIMDEATASIDPMTEAQIQEGLDLVLNRRTSILIAHRLSTILHADRIIVLRRGQIVEEGDHATLLERGGHYAHLYNTYFRHQIADYTPGEGFVPVQAGTVR